MVTEVAFGLIPHGLGNHVRGDGELHGPCGLEHLASLLLTGIRHRHYLEATAFFDEDGDRVHRRWVLWAGGGGVTGWRMTSKGACVSGGTCTGGCGALQA